MIRYIISTKQMQDLDILHHRNSTELNTPLQQTCKYPKSPQKNGKSWKNTRKIKNTIYLNRTSMKPNTNNQNGGMARGLPWKGAWEDSKCIQPQEAPIPSAHRSRTRGKKAQRGEKGGGGAARV